MAEAISQRPVPAPEVLDLINDTSSDPLELVTSRVDTTVSLGAWLNSHPVDKITVVAPVSGIDDPFCRGAVAKVQLMGRTFIRSAMFSIPEPPKGEKLPSDTAMVAQDYCELRTVVLASDEMEVPAGQALRDSLAVLIDKRLGGHSDVLPLGAGGLSGTEEGKIWNGPGTRVVVATAPVDLAASTSAAPGAEGNKTAPVNATPKNVFGKTFVVAYAPGSGAQDFDTWQARYNGEAARRAADRQTRYRSVDSALVWAGLPSVTSDLKTVLTYLRRRDEDKPGELRPPQIDAALLRAIKTIHDAAPTLPAPRRAAALLAGDVTVAATLATPAADSSARTSLALVPLGFSFKPDEEGGYRNTRAWLWQAYQIDSTGRAGRVAFAELLGLWWPDSDACTSDEYARIIAHGEAELAKGDDNPLIHFYVGSAYKSIYDFAHFESEEYGPPASVREQAETARLKGIEHFRAALSSLAEPPLRREAWTKAMRLILRRTGEQPEYVCLPD